MSQKPNSNVIVFGETGAGKSSVINMILGSDRAKVSNRAVGETFKTTVYPVELFGNTYNLHDTAGLGEHSAGTVDSAKAVGNLYRLVINLSQSGGVNLLVFVIRRGRLTDTIHKNYDLFYRAFCDSKVPVVIIVTGCEDVEPTMDTWWTENEQTFAQAGMTFDDHACVCAFAGTKGRNRDHVQESLIVVKQCVLQRCAPIGWEIPPILWLKKVVRSMVDLFRSSKIPLVYSDLYDRLTNVVTVSEAEKIIESILHENGIQSIPNVIVFGETGAGKSSVVNLILGSDQATVGDGAVGETFRTTNYVTEIDGKTYNLHDTVGLGEHSRGTVDSAKAVGNLYCLLTDLSTSGGVNLLVFVVKCGRLTDSIHKNYNLFHQSFCDSKVPIVIVVTGCENVEPTMDTWWTRNERWFTQAGMPFNGHACVCAFRGTRANNGEYRNEDLIGVSVKAVKELIVHYCASDGWKKPRIIWLQMVIGSMMDLFRSSKIPLVYTNLYNRLTKAFSSSEAEAIINAVIQSNSIPNVIVFGETGAGKSSVIKMILGSNNANVSDDALGGQLFRGNSYSVEINGKIYRLHDTDGLGTRIGESVDSAKAAGNLFRLLDALSNSGGVNLLVYVVKCSNKRAAETMRKYYSLVHHGFCDSKVPVVLIVTHCEKAKPSIDTWWTENERSFTHAGMSFNGHACVCASMATSKKRSGFRSEEGAKESAELVKQLIAQHCMSTGWKKERIDSQPRMVGKKFAFMAIPLYKGLHDRLTTVFSTSAAENIIMAIFKTGK